jgi:putative salt-induced outer membrane protein YdiY
MILPIALLVSLPSSPAALELLPVDATSIAGVSTDAEPLEIDAAPAIAPFLEPARAQDPPKDGEPPKPGEPPEWTGSVAVGATYSDGNTDERSVNAALDAERRSAKDRWTVKGWWNYGETKNQDTNEFDLTQRRAGGTLKYDYFLSKKLYVFAVGGVETDTKADIKLRMYAGPGVGYQWREDDDLKWGSELGVTYFDVDYYESEDKEYVSARVANNIAWKINENTALENTIEAFPSLEDADDFYGKSDTKVKVSLSKAMFAQLQWIYQYNNQPADGKARNDNQLVLGVGWSF